MFEVGMRKRAGSFSGTVLASMDVRCSIAQDGSRWDIIEDLDLFYFRQLAVSLQDLDMQQKIDIEIKMREGTRKLLAACRREAQILEAAKNLLTSNVRVLSYMSELQHRKTAQFAASRAASRRLKSDSTDSGLEAEAVAGETHPCTATLCVSDLQVPLMWKDVDHIKNKGDHHRYAVFCLLKVDSQIYATQLVSNIDRKSTDVTFEDVIVFDNVKSDFSCILEVYSYNLHNDMTMASTPQRIRRKLNSLSSSVSRRSSLGHRASVRNTAPEEEQSEGPKFSLVARARLRPKDVSDQVQTFDLSPEKDDNTHHQLPLFGNLCCRLAMQPKYMVQPSIAGYLTCQGDFEGEAPPGKLWCRLQGLHLTCWDDASDVNRGEARMSLQLQKTSSAVRSPNSASIEPLTFVVSGCYGDPGRRHTFVAESEELLESWLKAFEEQLVNIEAWADSCQVPMKMYSPFPRRADLVLRERKGSIYDDLSLVSPDRTEADSENVFQGSPADNLRSRRKVQSQHLSVAVAGTSSSSSVSSSVSSSASSASPPLSPFQRMTIPSPSGLSSVSSAASVQGPSLFPFQKSALPKETRV